MLPAMPENRPGRCNEGHCDHQVQVERFRLLISLTEAFAVCPVKQADCTVHPGVDTDYLRQSSCAQANR